MTDADISNHHTSPHLVRQLGLGSGIAVVIGSMIGSGIFKSPSDIAAKLPGPLPIILVWVTGGLFAICGALTLMEVGGAFPYSGGLYVFIREAFGRLAAFMYGWSNMLITPASNGAVAIVFSQYAFRLFGLSQSDPTYAIKVEILAIAAVIGITYANVRGIRSGAGIQNLTTIAKTGGLLTLIALSLTVGMSQGGTAHFTPAMPAGSFSLSMFGLALVSVLFACDGWMNVCLVSGEMTDPRKNLPRAIVIGTVGVVAIYILTNIAYMAAFPVNEVAKSHTIAADTMMKFVGNFGVTFITATVMLSTLGALNGGVLTSPRIHFAMAEDGLFFPLFGKVHDRFRTPVVAIIASGIAGICYIITATMFSGAKAFNALVDACVIGNLPFYAMAVGSIFLFRKRAKAVAPITQETATVEDSLISHLSSSKSQPYSPPVMTPMFPIPPVLFIVSVFILIINSFYHEESRVPSVAILALLSLGIPLYYGLIRKMNPLTK